MFVRQNISSPQGSLNYPGGSLHNKAGNPKKTYSLKSRHRLHLAPSKKMHNYSFRTHLKYPFSQFLATSTALRPHLIRVHFHTAPSAQPPSQSDQDGLLSRIVDSFDAPIRFVAAYGSSIYPQMNQKVTKEKVFVSVKLHLYRLDDRFHLRCDTSPALAFTELTNPPPTLFFHEIFQLKRNSSAPR